MNPVQQYIAPHDPERTRTRIYLTLAAANQMRAARAKVGALGDGRSATPLDNAMARLVERASTLLRDALHPGGQAVTAAVMAPRIAALRGLVDAVCDRTELGERLLLAVEEGDDAGFDEAARDLVRELAPEDRDDAAQLHEPARWLMSRLQGRARKRNFPQESHYRNYRIWAVREAEWLILGLPSGAEALEVDGDDAARARDAVREGSTDYWVAGLPRFFGDLAEIEGRLLSNSRELPTPFRDQLYWMGDHLRTLLEAATCPRALRSVWASRPERHDGDAALVRHTAERFCGLSLDLESKRVAAPLQSHVRSLLDGSSSPRRAPWRAPDMPRHERPWRERSEGDAALPARVWVPSPSDLVGQCKLRGRPAARAGGTANAKPGSGNRSFADFISIFAEPFDLFIAPAPAEGRPDAHELVVQVAPGGVSEGTAVVELFDGDEAVARQDVPLRRGVAAMTFDLPESGALTWEVALHEDPFASEPGR
ncbi:MAG: hypothetical protein U0324_16030 [Polyangiales bacterium]